MADQAFVDFTADSVSAGVSSFSVAPSTATVAASASASGRPVVTIELTDQFGNPVSNLASSVTLALGGAVASTSLGVVETSTSGTYTTAINSVSPGSVTFAVFVGGAQIGSR